MLKGLVNKRIPFRKCGRSGIMIRAFRSFPSKPKVTRAEIGNIAWPREELLEIARLLDHLAPPSSHDPERYFEQKGGVSPELRWLAHWARRDPGRGLAHRDVCARAHHDRQAMSVATKNPRSWHYQLRSWRPSAASLRGCK
jgi:hypothetical protein